MAKENVLSTIQCWAICWLTQLALVQSILGIRRVDRSLLRPTRIPVWVGQTGQVGTEDQSVGEGSRRSGS